MATMRLVPSTYYRSNSSYVSVTDEDNMYTNTDSTTYASVRNSRNSTSNTYYCYLRGFNFSDIPADAEVTGFTIKIKASESYMSTSSSYRMSLYNGTSSISNTTLTSSLSTSINTFTFPIPSTLTWETLKGYGSNFGIRLPLRRSSTSSNSYVYVYGAEIEVTYTIPVFYDVTINNNTSASVTATDTNPLEGTDVEIRSNTISGVVIKDNGVDVTSQFTQRTETSESYTVNNVGSYGFTLNSSTGYYVSNNKGISKSAAVCRIDFHVPVAATITFTYINYAERSYDFGVFGNIDVELSNNYYAAGSSGATITDSNYKRACNTSAYNTSSVQTLTYDMSAGEHSIWVKYSKDDASDANNDTLQFNVSITLDEPFTPGQYYGYDIIGISADHVISVDYVSTRKTYIKVNGSWKEAVAIYAKVNGTWREVDKVYSKKNGTWSEENEKDSMFSQDALYLKGVD